MNGLKVRFGSTHFATHIDDQTKGKLIVGLACGGSQEITEENRDRFTIIHTDARNVGCPTCRMNLETEKDENTDEHSYVADG